MNLSEHIARTIFNVGDELGHKTQRIEFKAGSAPCGTEFGMGGLNLDALTDVIEDALDSLPEPPEEDE